MQKLMFMAILIVAGLVMISTTFTTHPIIAQSETDKTHMTNTTSTNITDTRNTNITENGQISKRD
jgi:hypothetical protein